MTFCIVGAERAGDERHARDAALADRAEVLPVSSTRTKNGREVLRTETRQDLVAPEEALTDLGVTSAVVASSTDSHGPGLLVGSGETWKSSSLRVRRAVQRCPGPHRPGIARPGCQNGTISVV